MLNEAEQKSLRLMVAMAKDRGIELKESIIDASKSFDENKEAILKTVGESKTKLAIKTTTRAKTPKQPQPQKSNEERKREAEELTRIIQEANKNIKCDGEITQYYENLRNSVERLVKGYVNSVFICGRAGTGKTFQTIAKLNEMGLKPNKDYVEFSGEMSSAFVYRFLCENNDKILIFRDLINLITTMRSLELLKTATETKEPRVIRKGNYSKSTDDLPSFFECKSRFIFEFNALRYNGLKEDIEALFSRGDYIVMSLSFDDIASIMTKIAKEDWEKEIVNFLKRNYKFVGINSLNLRTQKKAFGIYKWCEETKRDWREELVKYLRSEMSVIRRTLYNYIGDRVVKTSELKKILVLGNIAGVNTLRSADRRIREWILMNELFVVGSVGLDEEELERFMNTHRNYAVSLNPITMIVEEKEKTEDRLPPQEISAIPAVS